MKSCLLLTLAAATAVCASALSQEPASARLVQTILLPEVLGGFNHMAADAEHHRLFATATGKKSVEIVDVAAGKLERVLDGPGPAATCYAPEFKQLYVTRGQAVHIYDGETFELLKRVELSTGLDELHYVASEQRLYVGCMSEGSTGVAVLELPGGNLLGRIALASKLQAFAVEKRGGRLFANIPSRGRIDVVDRQRRSVVESWPLEGAEANYSMALDESHARLFVGCRRPAVLLVLDTVSGKIVAKVPISEDTDDLSYDPAGKHIYSSGGSGFLDVIEQRGPDAYVNLPPVKTRKSARNSCFSPGLDALFLAVPANGDQPAEIRMYQR